jgi:hypothetical protein
MSITGALQHRAQSGRLRSSRRRVHGGRIIVQSLALICPARRPKNDPGNVRRKQAGEDAVALTTTACA